jgi:hypothetical protein
VARRARSRRSRKLTALRHRRSELQHPAADRFIGNIEPTLGKEIFHVAVAQGEAKMEPDRVLDNRRRKAVAAIGEQGHAQMLSYPPFLRSPVSVTMQFRLFLHAGAYWLLWSMRRVMPKRSIWRVCSSTPCDCAFLNSSPASSS